MIPRRVWVKGFLSYREERELCFDGGSLWMLAGPNGSGKSTVFDAVTYALFGQHRGGKQNAKELINKESEGLAVEFDFVLEGQMYQARRTLKRKSNRSTRQIHRQTPDGWEAVADTNTEEGFNAWVREHIGLNYETFTSSVLLLQGKAEKLLAADPADRFRVLAGVVDLGRYQRLFERAEARRKEFEGACASLEQQLADGAEVSAVELASAERRVTDADAARSAARAAAEREQRLELLAERWAVLTARLAEAEADGARAADQLAQADAVRRDWSRFQELSTVLSDLEAIAAGRFAAASAAEKARQLADDRDRLAAELVRVEALERKTRLRRDEARASMEREEEAEQQLGLRLRELSALVARAAAYEAQREELDRVARELTGRPADLADRLDRARQEVERRESIRQALPAMRRLAEARAALREAADQVTRAGRAAKAARESAAELEPARLAAERRAQDADRRHSEARDRATKALALLDEARAAVEEFGTLEGARRCRHCGQELTSGHFEAERARRLRDQLDAEARHRDALADAAHAAREEKIAHGLWQDWENRRQEALAEAAEHDRLRQQAERDAQRLAAECERASDELAEPFRVRIVRESGGNGAETEYPSAADLAELECQAAGLDNARRALGDLQAAVSKWAGLEVRSATLRDALARTSPPADLESLRAEDARLTAEEKRLKDAVASSRLTLREDENLLDRLAEQGRELARQLAGVERQANDETASRRVAEAQVAGATARLPENWRSVAASFTGTELEAWRAERDRLASLGLEERLRELDEARNRVEDARARADVARQEQADIPADARRDPSQIREARAAADAQLRRCEEAVAQARQEFGRLQDRRGQREELRQRLRDADRQQVLYRTLAEHLGRKGLQRHLIRQAERGVVDFANGVLDRLTGGRFCLRLKGGDAGDAEQALELEAYDRQRNQAYGLPFLSGSQRFRVAVSLALGIGQYASRRHRPIESVIIDEGFGCLDREGRQVMIQELQNLRTQLRCILLVSHQEEFADAFADGYRFELAEGTTQVTRFQR